jgi:hypothetical protein
MTDPQNNRRFWEVMIGLFLLIFGLAALGGSGSAFPLFLGLIGFYLLARQFDRSKAKLGDLDRRLETSVPEAPARQNIGADQVYRHAIDAVRRAGRDPGDTQVLPVDIGVIALRAGVDPVVHRSQPVDDDVDYIQPFVQLRLPQRAMGRVRFEIIDSDGQTLFIHEDMHELERGRNLVTPSARLPIHDAHNMHGQWELQVSADGMLLATHRFTWREGAEKVIRRHVREDGEISNELRAAIIENDPGSVSLDDLLAFQEDEGQQSAGHR